MTSRATTPRSPRRVLVVVALVGVAFALGLGLGASRPAPVADPGSDQRSEVGASVKRPAAETDLDEPARHERGREVYNFRCYFCHGYGGDAKTLAATYLDPAPRDFTADAARALDLTAIRHVVRDGRAGTAMKSFVAVLTPAEIDAVAAFVRREFIEQRAPNTRYHTPANGWPDHERRYGDAFAFATGALPLDHDPSQLTPSQRRGLDLFRTGCMSCHDGTTAAASGPAWSARPVSYPRAGFVYDPQTPAVDAISSATPYAQHDRAPRLEGLSARQRRGRSLYQTNCAFCHGGDGSGMNWIGQFMEPKARDLRAFDARSMPAARLRTTIADGLEGTSMPAWRHVLSPRDIDAVASYVERAFFGTGTRLANADRIPPRR